MDQLLFSIGIALVLVALIVFTWRLLSRRHLLPCPPALIWMLENRIMENVAGSEALIRRAEIIPGMHVLDAGCGPGRVSLPLAAFLGPSGKVAALDVQAEMLEHLRARAEEQGTKNLELINAGLGEGQLPPSTFDRALMVTVLGEIPDQVKALREIYGALKPQGILSITEVLPDPHYQSQKKVRQLAQACGFSVTVAFVGRRAYTLNLTKPLADP